MGSIKLNMSGTSRSASFKRTAGPGGGGLAGGGGFGFGGASGGFGFGSAGGRVSQNRYNPVYDDLSEGSIIEQFMPVDPRRLHRIWRRIKLQDPVAGPAIDLYSELPWSDFQLIGIEDRTIAQLYTDALNNINLTTLLPEISAEFLSMGKVIGHLIMDESKGVWNRMIIHDPDWIRVTPIPVPGFQPKMDIIPTPDMRAWAFSQDPRDMDAMESIGEIAEMIRSGREIPLPPENSFYIPRRTAPYDAVGASAYTRIIMFVAYEKALVNSTIAASRRRASRIRHVTAGLDEIWEPSKEELDDYVDLFARADEDPVGAIVATRTGVSVNEVGGGSVQDMVKISDEWQFLLQGKLNALGVSEAFLTGEATYNTLEQLMSVFLEKVRAHRKFFEYTLIYDKLLKPLARKHGFFHRKKAELSHRIRVARSENDQNLILPTLAWAKPLRPVADRDYLEILQMMEEKGVPITKRTWTSAAGFDLDSEIEQFDDDIETTRQLAAQRKKVVAIAPESANGGGLGDMGMGGGLGGGLGGDLGGLGGDLGLGGGGLGGGGGGGDMGGLGGLGGPGGSPGNPPGGGGTAGAPLELPQIGASVKTAAARNYAEERVSFESLNNLPIWGRKKEFLGVSKDMAELAARRLLDSLNGSLARTLTKAETNKILSTGNNRRDQVLRYILSSIGVIRNADISKDAAADIQKELQHLLRSNPMALRKELSVVASCSRLGGLKTALSQSQRDHEYRAQKFSQPTVAELSNGTRSLIAQEKKFVSGSNLLTGFVANKEILEDK